MAAQAVRGLGEQLKVQMAQVDKEKLSKSARSVATGILAGVGAVSLGSLAVAYGAGVVAYGATLGVINWITGHLVPEVYKPAVDNLVGPKLHDLEERVAHLEREMFRRSRNGAHGRGE